MSAIPPTSAKSGHHFRSALCQEETLRGYPELAIWSLMRLSSISRIGSHHFLRSVHNSWQPDREGQSATRLALDRDVAAHHLTEVRLMATPRPVPLYLRAVADEIWEDSWNSSFTYPAATAQSAQGAASNGLR
jgi:hypothetical protein